MVLETPDVVWSTLDLILMFNQNIPLGGVEGEVWLEACDGIMTAGIHTGWAVVSKSLQTFILRIYDF